MRRNDIDLKTLTKLLWSKMSSMISLFPFLFPPPSSYKTQQVPIFIALHFSVKFISRKNTYIHTYDVAEYYWILKNIRNPGFEFWKFRGKIGSRQIESLDLACVWSFSKNVTLSKPLKNFEKSSHGQKMKRPTCWI